MAIQRRVARIPQQQRADQGGASRLARRQAFAGKQRCKHAAPAVERGEVVELRDRGIDQAGAAQHHPRLVAGPPIGFVRLLEMAAGLPRTALGAAHAERVVQPGIRCEQLGRQKIEPSGQRLVAALLEHRVRLLRGDHRHPRPVLILDHERHGVVRVPGAVQQQRCFLELRAREGFGHVLRRATTQELMQQGMHLVRAPGVGCDLFDEIVVVRKIREQPCRLRLAGKRLRHPGRHPRQAGDLEQELLRPRLEPVENLAGEVIEDPGGRRVARYLRHAP